MAICYISEQQNGMTSRQLQQKDHQMMEKAGKLLVKFPGLISSLVEPPVLELKSGKLIAMIRNEPKDVSQCFLLQSESRDSGKTWSPMKSTGIWGYPPHLIQLKNGWLLVA